MPKIEPAVRTLTYILPDGASYIDLAKDLSKVNRRLYRQGMSYVVQDIQIGMQAGMLPTDIYQITFSTAGNSWIVHNAWKKAFSAWRAQQRRVTEAIGDIHGKWADFKVYLDDSMRTGTTLDVYAGDAAVYQAGEWEYSKFVVDDDGDEDEFYCHIIGSTDFTAADNTSSIGLINEYQNSRPNQDALLPLVPGGVSDTLYAKLMDTDEMSDMLIDNVEGDNDRSPYDPDDYPGGAANADAPVMMRIGSVNATMSTATLPGFVAECGLIKVVTNEAALATSGPAVYEVVTAPNAFIQITVAAGPYRGVLAAPMGQ